MQRKITLELTRTEIDQLLSYAMQRDRDGWYYGPRKHFEKRHQAILDALCDALEIPRISGGEE